uniref:Cysteine protease n=1 Tax=Takifugu rubripes TaxID=31033 RepID=A0A674P651_TAKRU
MNSVSPTATQYVTGGMQDELAENRRQQPLEHQGSFGPRLPQPTDAGREVPGEPDEMDKLKAKLMSAWNNVKYGWTVKSKTSFNKISPVTILGDSYLLNSEDEVERFRLAFVSRIWLTYRKEFPQLEGSTWTTDCGWGCMLRSGQMLLAQGLLVHLMPRGWTWPDAQLESLVFWFGDQPTAPFGIHQLVEIGKSAGKKAGDWYGPAIVAHILRKAVARASAVHSLVVYVAQDCTVYKEDVMHLCDPTPTWKSVIILVPVRLGGECLNPSYIECVKNILKLDCCIGIIGGKPKHSLYFVGFQDEQLLYLDPHYCQPVVDVSQVNSSLESFHCNAPKKMPFNRMDPSCTIGFYAKSKKDFESLCSAVGTALSSSKERYPLFTFIEGRSQDYGLEGQSTNTGPAAHILPPGKLGRSNHRRNSDEFVFL